MASTYSTNLAIELIGTGDQAGAWGNTTNTNLGTLIEQAISGYVTQAVATGTDTSITIPNGATGVARNMYIELTGTGGTNTNLIVPANKKLYFIYNNTSSGQVTVKVAGQTGVSVPNGKKMVLVSNGTDIVDGLNYIANFGTNSLVVTNLTATSATVTTLTGTSSNITTLSGTTIGYTSGTLTNLNVTSLTVSSLSLSNATLTSASITTLTATSGTITTLKSTSATIDNLASTSANIATLTGTNFSAASLTLTNALKVAQGGTGLSSTPTNGQLLIGNGTGFNLNTLNGGPGVGITNQSGAITITATGTGFIASVSATSPLQSTGVQSVVISIASSTGSGAVVLADSPTMSSATITQLASTSATITTIKGTSASITTITGNLVGNASTATTATTATNVASGGQINAASATITTITGTSASITTITGNLVGNASTATNGVVTTGSYANPSWITSLATSKLTGTVAVANGGTALSSTPTNGQLLIGNGSGYALSTLTAGSGISIANNAGSIAISATASTGDITFTSAVISTSGTNQNMVLDPNGTGKVLVNTTSVIGSIGANAAFQVSGSAGIVYPAIIQTISYPRACLSLWNNDGSRGTNNGQYVWFYLDPTEDFKGSITYNDASGQIAYNVTSDRRIKTIYGPTTNSGALIDSLKVYDGKINSGSLTFPLMIADEVQQVTPYCVTGQPNAVSDSGKPIYQQVDYTSLVPLLIAELQSLRARVAALEAAS